MAQIDVNQDGPYQVSGQVPLRRKRAETTELGEPVGWQDDELLATDDTYWLCRCGGSENKPFCDGSHRRIGFDGTEAAPTDSFAERATDYPAGTVTVQDDRAICQHAGFCGSKVTNVWKMTQQANDDGVRAQMLAMIDRCPSGALSYGVGGTPVEPDLPAEVGIIDDGPLFVTGGVTINRADGQPLETRNRVTLCRCGQSAIKPFCDGSHTKAGFSDHA
jgi:CDGSH-type Zn-finger protein